MTTKTLNTFHKGMTADVDKHQQPDGTFRYALGGRIRFNTKRVGADGLQVASKDGATYSFCNENGNKLVSNICEGYVIVGHCDMEDECILFSTNGVDSEIGVLYVDSATEVFYYTTLFNDRYDPNGDRLRFDENYYTTSEPSIESPSIRRSYFTDNNKEPRVINLSLFYTSVAGVRYPYHSLFMPDGTVVQPNCSEAPTPYPHWLSVHSFAERTDMRVSKIRFVQTILGTLKTGVYQYAYRLVTADGHKTVWSMITRHLFLTSKDIPDINHHHYQMYASNVMTSKGIRLLIPLVDTRYHKIEVAYIFSVTDEATEEAAVFYDELIDPLVPNLTIDHTNASGIPVLLEEFGAIYTWLEKSPTVGVHKNKLFHGGGETTKPLWIDTAGIQISTVNRYFVPDETGLVTYSDPPVGIGEEYTDPLTNTQPQTTSLLYSTFNGLVEGYSVVNDYVSYKGMQFEHLFTGYWRGETYRVGALLFDRKGVPFFVQHIADFTFPQQYEGQNLTRYNALIDKYEIRILGMMLDNIKIPHSIMFNEFGEINISGFAIVRTKRTDPRILHQGILLNTVHEPRCEDDDGSIEKRLYTRPMPHLSNYFEQDYSDGYPDSHLYDVRFDSFCDDFIGTGWTAEYTKFSNRPATFTYHSPDVLITQSIIPSEDTHYMKLVGTVMSNRLPVTSEILLHHAPAPSNEHYYAKMYKTDDRVKRYEMGAESRVRKTYLLDVYEVIDGYDEYDTELRWSPFSRYQSLLEPDQIKRAIAHPNTVLMLLKDWEAIDVVEDDNPAYPEGQRSTYHLVNYVVPQTQNKSLELSIYQSTGHYQHINETVLMQAIKEYDGSGNIINYIFNQVEVWGGDCYVNLFDLTRLYPEFSNCDKDDGVYHDYAVSQIVPIESNFNLAMRYGRSFAKDATNPEITSCQNSNLQFKNGVMREQPADWNVNKALKHQENVQFYFPLPADIKIEYRFPYRIFYSKQKTYNELDDNFRKLLPLSFADLQGSYGAITGLSTLFDYLFCFQEKAYGVLRVNERAAVPDAEGRQLTIGTGLDLGGIDYTSTIFGCQHRDSIVRMHHGLYWVDARMNKFCRHSQAGNDRYSDMYGQHDFSAHVLPLLTNDSLDPAFNQTRRIVATADYKNNEVITTIYYNDTNKFYPFTVVFAEDINAFAPYSPATPKVYIAHKKFILMPNYNGSNQNELYLHGKGRKGEYFGVFHNTKLVFIVNPSPTKTSYFDSMLLNVNHAGKNRIISVVCRSENPLNANDVLPQVHTMLLPTDSRAVYRNDKLLFPLRQLKAITGIELGRLRGDFIEVELEILNDESDIEVCLVTAETNYRTLNRI